MQPRGDRDLPVQDLLDRTTLQPGCSCAPPSTRTCAVPPHGPCPRGRLLPSRTTTATSTAVHRCVRVDKCRADNSAAGGFMCPPATRDEGLDARACPACSGDGQRLARHAAGPPRVHGRSTCACCKACSSDCPQRRHGSTVRCCTARTASACAREPLRARLAAPVVASDHLGPGTRAPRQRGARCGPSRGSCCAWVGWTPGADRELRPRRGGALPRAGHRAAHAIAEILAGDTHIWPCPTTPRRDPRPRTPIIATGGRVRAPPGRRRRPRAVSAVGRLLRRHPRPRGPARGARSCARRATGAPARARRVLRAHVDLDGPGRRARSRLGGSWTRAVRRQRHPDRQARAVLHGRAAQTSGTCSRATTARPRSRGYPHARRCSPHPPLRPRQWRSPTCPT